MVNSAWVVGALSLAPPDAPVVESLADADAPAVLVEAEPVLVEDVAPPVVTDAVAELVVA